MLICLSRVYRCGGDKAGQIKVLKLRRIAVLHSETLSQEFNVFIILHWISH